MLFVPNIAILETKWNQDIIAKLKQGVDSYCQHHNFATATFEASGALELPLLCLTIANSQKFDGIVALGCVIRGETSHYDMVCEHSIGGIMQVQLQTQIPIGVGILTVENKQQALERSKPIHAIDDIAKLQKSNAGYLATEAVHQSLQSIEQIHGI